MIEVVELLLHVWVCMMQPAGSLICLLSLFFGCGVYVCKLLVSLASEAISLFVCYLQSVLSISVQVSLQSAQSLSLASLFNIFVVEIMNWKSPVYWVLEIWFTQKINIQLLLITFMLFQTFMLFFFQCKTKSIFNFLFNIILYTTVQKCRVGKILFSLRLYLFDYFF